MCEGGVIQARLSRARAFGTSAGEGEKISCVSQATQHARESNDEPTTVAALEQLGSARLRHSCAASTFRETHA